MKYAALDVETANREPGTVCAIGLVVVRDREVISAQFSLVNPGEVAFGYARLHGIGRALAAGAPTLGELWPTLRSRLAGTAFVAAHNAQFDRRALEEVCRRAGVGPSALPFLCTARLARCCFGIRPADLDSVCARLGIGLKHHDALSDALACAQVTAEAIRRFGEERVLQLVTPAVHYS